MRLALLRVAFGARRPFEQAEIRDQAGDFAQGVEAPVGGVRAVAEARGERDDVQPGVRIDRILPPEGFGLHAEQPGEDVPKIRPVAAAGLQRLDGSRVREATGPRVDPVRGELPVHERRRIVADPIRRLEPHRPPLRGHQRRERRPTSARRETGHAHPRRIPPRRDRPREGRELEAALHPVRVAGDDSARREVQLAGVERLHHDRPVRPVDPRLAVERLDRLPRIHETFPKRRRTQAT